MLDNCPASSAAHRAGGSNGYSWVTGPTSQERIGEVDFGASLQSMEAALKESVSMQVSHPECLMVAIKAYPGSLFMVEQGRITRADAAPESPNLLGVKVCDSRSAVL